MSANAVTHQQSTLLCDLREAYEFNESGNKAGNLARMLALGLNVPGGFVITELASADRSSPHNLHDMTLGDAGTRQKGIKKKIIISLDYAN